MKIRMQFLILFFVKIAVAQEIVSLPVNNAPIIYLGQQANISFFVNQLTTCDFYTVTTNVDYFAKRVDINVDYNYNSACSPSVGKTFEVRQNQILLTGTNFVYINVKVLTNVTLNETKVLTPITVLDPTTFICNDPSIPFTQEICPPVNNAVCACNGRTYDNECSAYLLDKNGNYQYLNCPAYIQSNELQYDCQVHYTNASVNFFELYECDASYYKGNEIIIRYEHLSNDTLKLNYVGSDTYMAVFLTKMEGLNVKCINKFTDGKVVQPDLPFGTYYLIVDYPFQQQNFYIEFCKSTPVNDEELAVFESLPNPITDHLQIEDKYNLIHHVEILDIYGNKVRSSNRQSSEFYINTVDLKGFYVVNVFMKNGHTAKRKVLII